MSDEGVTLSVDVEMANSIADALLSVTDNVRNKFPDVTQADLLAAYSMALVTCARTWGADKDDLLSMVRKMLEAPLHLVGPTGQA